MPPRTSAPVIHPSQYETEAALSQYLLFHYGLEQDLLPYAFGPKDALHFPIRCVTACLDRQALPPQARALDLGCAVGRSSFELARSCVHVTAIDNSKTFITAARHIQTNGQLEYTVLEEGQQLGMRIARRPEDIDATRIVFCCRDAMDLDQTTSPFDVVLAANLLCRLGHPEAFLRQLPGLVAAGGQLILTSPYSWLEEFTPRRRWLGGPTGADKKSPLALVEEILEGAFMLQRALDIPFLMREHRRKYQWGVSEASIWKRKA